MVLINMTVRKEYLEELQQTINALVKQKKDLAFAIRVLEEQRNKLVSETLKEI